MVVIRDFEREDYKKGLLETLKEVWYLTEISEKTLDEWIGNDNHMVVAELDGVIVGTATLHLQKKTNQRWWNCGTDRGCCGKRDSQRSKQNNGS